MRMVAAALRLPQVTQYAHHFHNVVQLVLEGDATSEADTEVLAAMMSAQGALGEVVTSQSVAGGFAFERVGNVHPSKEDGSHDVLPSLKQVTDPNRNPNPNHDALPSLKQARYGSNHASVRVKEMGSHKVTHTQEERGGLSSISACPALAIEQVLGLWAA
jgi:hypothetical protein